ncbi:serine:threonine protein kinase TNNI3K [Trichuris trichiura]|uniref:Serine:threonine protein kinase TNNI3K n=1 Tax=Trichuris trichiura TaxID=36087 RepID=A0A077YYU5_TRITR|nr:serine:threonine protein kinase TNNI3K [Trichuris trichiura]
MGNYKTRPRHSFSDELYRKVARGYRVLRSRLECDANADLVEDDFSANSFESFHLLRAIYDNKLEPVEQWLEAGNCLDALTWFGMPALHVAVLCNNVQAVELLLKYGANIDAIDWAHFTPIHIASFFGYERVARLLSKSGAKPNQRASVGDSPLHLAAFNGHMSVVHELLEHGACVNRKDEEGNSALHFCAKSGHARGLCLLLEVDCSSVHDQNLHGDTALHLACYGGHLECATVLIQRCGFDSLVKENIFSETPLHCACSGGKSLELVAFLLRQPGVNINFQGQDGHTALHSACYNGCADLVEFLLDQGADPDISAYPNLVKAAHESPINAYKELESSGDSVSRFGQSAFHEKQTPIMWAYEKGRPKIGTPINRKCVFEGFDPIVDILKRRKAVQSAAAFKTGRAERDSTFVTLPSPLGKLRSITKEKAEVLQLRNLLGNQHHMELAEIDFQEAIGSGSFGKVYKGVYKGKTVAVKRYRAAKFGVKSDVEMFCREVSILSRLNHPNVLKFVGACLNDPSQFALVTEYASGGSLFILLHEQKAILPLSRKLSIGLDIAKGMEYLHGLPVPVIHRDLNSHNVLLEGDTAIVADFGESRFLGSAGFDMTKQPGNLRWMAPEVFLQSTSYSTKADVFSYALCVWEIHVGDLPFSHLKPAAAALEMAYKGSRPSLARCIPEPVQAIIQQAWQENPEASILSRPIVTEMSQFCDSIADNDDNRPVEMLQRGNAGSFAGIAEDPRFVGSTDAVTCNSMLIQDLLKIVDENGNYC